MLKEKLNAGNVMQCVSKDNSGHENLASHVKTKHSSTWQEELTEHLQGATRGPLQSFITIKKVVSDEAKNINSWIEWINVLGLI